MAVHATKSTPFQPLISVSSTTYFHVRPGDYRFRTPQFQLPGHVLERPEVHPESLKWPGPIQDIKLCNAGEDQHSKSAKHPAPVEMFQ
jgi:hypothetical protein